MARRLDPTNPLIQSGRLTPVVYRLNLKDANSLFLAQRFPIANGDLIYVSNAPSTEVQKVFEIMSGGICDRRRRRQHRHRGGGEVMHAGKFDSLSACFVLPPMARLHRL